MTNTNNVRRAHDLLDELDARAELSQEQEKLLRSFLPELPKQKTLEELCHTVYAAWSGTHGNKWLDDIDGDLEIWLYELHQQLKGLAAAESAHPEFLETEADYENAPNGTIVVKVDALPWAKEDNGWTCAGASKGDYGMSLAGSRRILRWGWGE